MAFAALMRQECGWFDHEDHAVGVLSSRLTGDASNLQAVSFQEFPPCMWKKKL